MPISRAPIKEKENSRLQKVNRPMRRLLMHTSRPAVNARRPISPRQPNEILLRLWQYAALT
jgi:hypothetical protein